MKIFKKWYFWIILILAICLIITIFVLNRKKGVGKAGISKAEFDKIQLGMTQGDVHAIIDEANEWKNNDIYAKCCEEISKSEKNHIYSYQYKYYGEKSGYAIITYEADYTNTYLFVYPEVVKKESFDLK